VTARPANRDIRSIWFMAHTAGEGCWGIEAVIEGNSKFISIVHCSAIGKATCLPSRRRAICAVFTVMMTSKAPRSVDEFKYFNFPHREF
jgi:hypothetical protein